MMGGIGALRPVGPLLEPVAAAVVGQPDDPQIAVLLTGRISIPDPGPDYRRRVIDSEDISDQGEDLAGAFSFLLPHLLDRIQAIDRLFIRRLKVGRVTSKQAGEALGTRRPPGGLIIGQPPAYHRTVGHVLQGALIGLADASPT